MLLVVLLSLLFITQSKQENDCYVLMQENYKLLMNKNLYYSIPNTITRYS